MPTFKNLLNALIGRSTGAAARAAARDSTGEQKTRIDHPEDRDVFNEGETLYEDFTVDKLLGEGGFGSVYLVHDTESSVRYILKRAKFIDHATAQRFAEAIYSWIDLPSSQYLVSCRFARTSGNEVDLFLEKFDGTSLAELIKSRKLYIENTKACQEKLLNIAMHSAWALAAINDLDQIHHNVQPNNFYISGQGAVKVTDIGMTHAAVSCELKDTTKSIPVIPSAYASPEQRRSEPVSYATDIWSWGTTVLEMFTGGVNWPDGEPAAYLEWYLSTGPAPEEKNIPPLPVEIAEVLRRCFMADPTERWGSASEAADHLRQAFKPVTGKASATKKPPHVHRGVLLGYSHSRWASVGGGKWMDPMQWVAKTDRLTGEKRSPKIRRGASDTGTLIGKALEDLPIYESCQKIYEEQITAGKTELLHEFSVFLGEKAFVHVALNDLDAALACFNQSIEILEAQIRDEGHAELSNDLGMAYLHRANALSRLGEFDAALGIYAQAIDTFATMVTKEGQKQFTGHLAWVRAIRGDVRFALAEAARNSSDQFFQQAVLLKEDGNAAFTFTVPRGVKFSPEDLIAKTAEARMAFNARAQALRSESDDLFRQAKAASALVRDLGRAGQDDIRTCLKLLKAEVSRTQRDDIKGILTWAETHFDGRL